MDGFDCEVSFMNGDRYSVVHAVLRVLKIGTISVGVFLAFVSLVEFVQAYQILSGVHPMIGWVFLVVVLAGVGAAVGFFAFRMTRRPPVLVPPPKQDLHSASLRQLRRYTRYLADVLNRLSQHPLIPLDERAGLKQQAEQLLDRARDCRDAADLVPHIDRCIDSTIAPAVRPLDEAAEESVRASVRDTMLAVAVSPWRSVDLLIVLYRNGQMVLDVSRIYNGSPRLREQLRVLGDVLKVVATVQFLNIGSKLMENMTSWIPVLGRFTDDIAQGIGAGLCTSVAGHAAIDRCHAFQGWDEREASEAMVPRLKVFMTDLKGIVSDTVMPALGGRIEAETPEDRRTPNLIERISAGIGDAIDTTSETLGTYVRRPVAAGRRGVATTGSFLWGGARRAGSGIRTAAVWSGKSGWQLSARGIKATARGTANGTRFVARGLSSTAKKAVRTIRRGKGTQE